MITLCEVEPIEEYGYKLIKDNSSKKMTKNEKKSISDILNNKKGMLHWLPCIKNFPGGLLNFTKIKSCSESEIENGFKIKDLRISSPYMKNILARFSSYYARQGQPDLDVDLYIDKLKSIK